MRGEREVAVGAWERRRAETEKRAMDRLREVFNLGHGELRVVVSKTAGTVTLDTNLRERVE